MNKTFMQGFTRIKGMTRLAAVTALLVCSAKAISSPILVDETLGGQIKVASAGEVWVEYLGSSAGYTNSLMFGDQVLFSNRDWWQQADALGGNYVKGNGCGTLDCQQYSRSQTGDTLSLGLWDAHTVLDFSLLTLTRRWTAEADAMIYQTGSADLNPDGVAHAFARTFWDADLDLMYTDIGFEDIWGGGDEDYNDIMFRAYNTYDPLPITEPSSLALLAIPLMLMFARRRRLRA